MAFGDRPADPVVVRPADPPGERWAAAVALGARGRYGAARALLDALRLDPATPPALRAHAAVTRAAHLRQLGGHLVARRWDGAGLALATAALPAEAATLPAAALPAAALPAEAATLPAAALPAATLPAATLPAATLPAATLPAATLPAATLPAGPAPGDPHAGNPHPGDAHSSNPHSSSPWSSNPHPGDVPDLVGADAAAARVDALLGLAADALGLGDLVLSARLLASAEPAARGHPSWRPLVRWRWVRAELALARDEAGDALELAVAAGAAARAANAVRHEVKSELIEVVARRCAGEGTEGLRRSLERLTERTSATRLGSLEWPTRSVLGELLSGVDPVAARAHAARVADLMAWIRRSTDPFGRSVTDRSPWVSDVLAR